MNNLFGLLVRQLRENKDWTREDLELKTVGYSTETIRSCEAGRRDPTKDLAESLADAFDLKPPARDDFKMLAQIARDKSASNESYSQVPLAGRRQQQASLQQIWQKVTEGNACFALITGEAGIGKTLLVKELESFVRRSDHDVGKASCPNSPRGFPYDPIKDWLKLPRLIAGSILLNDQEHDVLEPLRQRDSRGDPPKGAQGEQLTAEEIRRLRFEAFANACSAFDQVVPASALLLAINDLQWCDVETLDCIAYLLHKKPRARVLVVATMRPENADRDSEVMSWWSNLIGSGEVRDRVEEIKLEPFTEDEAIQLATQKYPTLTLDEIRYLHKISNGNPLFLSELMDEFVRRGAVDIHNLPTKIQALIRDRLKLLSPEARELAEYAAIVGQPFTVQLLQYASGWDEKEVNEAISQMVQRRIIEKNTISYDFIHDLLRNGTRAEIRPGDISELHTKMAQAYKRIFGEDLDSVSNQLASHYESAGELEQAIKYYVAASKSAQKLSANSAVVTYSDKGLQLLKLLPSNPKNKRQELDILIEKMSATVSLKGYAAAEVKDICIRASGLFQILQIKPLFPILLGRAMFHLVGAELGRAAAFGRDCLRVAEQMQDQGTGLLVESYALLGTIQYYQGKFSEAVEALEKGVSFYDAQHHSSLAFDYVQDSKVICLSFWGLSLWFKGLPGPALEKINEALAHAEAIFHPYSKALALFAKTWFYLLCKDWGATYEWAEELNELSREHQFVFWLALGLMFRGRAAADVGKNIEGSSQLDQYTKSYEETGARLALEFWFAITAEMLQDGGYIDEALGKLDDAFDLKKGEPPNEGAFYDAELHRLRGELLVVQSQEEEAEKCFLTAREKAMQQGAKALELRAVLSLCQLWVRQGEKEKGLEELQEIYDVFPKDFETADLRSAAVLLGELKD